MTGYEVALLGDDLEAERGGGGRGGGGGGRDQGREDTTQSYFDWNSDDVFIPRLPEKDAQGRPTTDQIAPGDDFQIKVSVVERSMI